MGFGKLAAIAHTAHAEEPAQARGVNPCADRVREGGALADRLIETRTAAAAQQRGEHVQHRHVGVRQVGDVPAQVEVRMLDRSQLQLLARRHLSGFRDEVVHRNGSS